MQWIDLPILSHKFSDDELPVVKQGNRLSVMPSAKAIAKQLLAMG
ncbi:MAG: hypothetical protein ACFB4I_18110 [Cyanophyceae cyanobacterium]